MVLNIDELAGDLEDSQESVPVRSPNLPPPTPSPTPSCSDSSSTLPKGSWASSRCSKKRKYEDSGEEKMFNTMHTYFAAKLDKPSTEDHYAECAGKLLTATLKRLTHAKQFQLMNRINAVVSEFTTEEN